MAKISKIHGRKILNSRGDWTIEVTLKLSNGISVKTSVPEGASSGKAEAVFVSPEKAIQNLKILEKNLLGQDPGKQKKIDQKLVRLDGTKNKSHLGANAILGVSLAAARAAAADQKIPLWKHLLRISGLISKPRTPKLFINVINGGLHARNNLDFQEYLIIPKSQNIKTSIAIGTKIYQELKKYLENHFGLGSTGIGDEGGFAPKFKSNLEPFEILRKVVLKCGFNRKVLYGMDAAASNVKIGKDQLFKIYKNLNLYYLEDPFRETDFGSFTKINQELGDKTLICGDDLTATNLKLMEKARAENAINCIIIKPNQIGTLTETLEAVSYAKKWGWKVVVSHRSGETEDDFIADLAYAVGADGIKLGAPARGERIAKYNRLLEISG